MNYLITRHPGALQWLEQQVAMPRMHLAHLENLRDLQRGDAVYGTLPIHLIAAVCARGAQYFHLEIDLPQDLRGQELSASQLDALNAELVEYFAMARLPDGHYLTMAKEREH